MSEAKEVRFADDLLAIAHGPGNRPAVRTRVIRRRDDGWQLGHAQDAPRRFAADRVAFTSAIVLRREGEATGRVLSRDGEAIREEVIPIEEGWSLATLSPDLRWAVAVPFLAPSSDPMLYFHGDSGWRVAGRLAGHATPVSVVAFSPDGRGIATGTEDGRLRLYREGADDAWSGIEIGRLGDDGESDAKRSVTSIVFDPSGRFLVTVDATNRVWRTDIDLDVLLARARRSAGRAMTDEERSIYTMGE
jgi:WD40 repeat protein